MLQIEPLSREGFAPFGEVIEPREADSFLINRGNTRRYHDLAQVQLNGGRALVSIFRAQPLPLPLEIALMEHHPLGSQAFIPLAPTPFLLVVALKGEYDNRQLRAFLTHGQQGVNYHAGVWHHPLIALDKVCDFLVIDRGGEGNNCIEVAIPAAERQLLALPSAN